MQRQLTLLRHAKSSWDGTHVKDRDRPLNERGERDAPLMGRRLRARGARPTLILTSPALRARRTAQVIASEINYRWNSCSVRIPVPRLADEIVNVIARQDSSFRDVSSAAIIPGSRNSPTGHGRRHRHVRPPASSSSVSSSTDGPTWRAHRGSSVGRLPRGAIGYSITHRQCAVDSPGIVEPGHDLEFRLQRVTMARTRSCPRHAVQSPSAQGPGVPSRVSARMPNP